MCNCFFPKASYLEENRAASTFFDAERIPKTKNVPYFWRFGRSKTQRQPQFLLLFQPTMRIHPNFELILQTFLPKNGLSNHLTLVRIDVLR